MLTYLTYFPHWQVAKLLRYESSRGEAGELISLDEYVGRMAPEQNEEIYWLLAPSRDSALSSAYMESFKAKGVEVPCAELEHARSSPSTS